MLEQIGAGFGMLMGLVLWFGMPTFSRLFTKDSMVLEIVASLTPVSVVTCLFRCPGFQG
jgi:Na+-driven multidrug efflux pump